MVLPNNKVRNIISAESNSFNGKYFYYTRIPSELLTNAREIHELGINEKVILLIDTAEFFHNGKKSVLFIERGISISSGNSFEGFDHTFIQWSDILDIKLINNNFVFYCDKNNLENNISIDQSLIITTDDDSLLRKESKLFIKIVKNIVNEFEKLKKDSGQKVIKIVNEFNENIEKQDYKKALELANKALKIFPDYNNSYLLKPIVLNKLSKFDEGLEYIDSAIKDLKFLKDGSKEDRNFLSSLFSLKAEILRNMKEYYRAALCISISENISPPKRKSLSKQNEYYKYYIEHFFDIEFNVRKILLVTNDLPVKQTKSFLIVLKNDLPNIEFPLGHPQINNLYFGHPYNKEIYYHYNNYESILMQEKLMELNNILECLGAKTIKIKTTEIKDFDNKKNTSLDFEAEASFKSGINYEQSTKSSDEYKLKSNNRISSEQSFSFDKDPYLPGNLIWFNHEPTWQNLVHQRFKGNIIKSIVKISSNDLEYITNSEKNKALGEVNLKILKLKASKEKDSFNEIKKETDLEWKIEVEFHPIIKTIESTNDDKLRLMKLQDRINDTEEEFIDLLKECIDDGKISEDERKILERYKKKYNISDQRSKELEDNLFQMYQLSDVETEYYEEVKFCLQEDNKISVDERRILERLRKKLNIDEKRAMKIENNLINK